MSSTSEQSVSRALFSLPTGVEAVTDRSGLRAVARAKQASVLFDEVVIETGMRIIELSERGVIAVMDRPASLITPALVNSSCSLAKGTKNGIAIVPGGDKIKIHVGTGLPRIEGAKYMEEEVTARYLSEYHTGILEDLASLGVSWIRPVSIKRPGDEEAEVQDHQLERLSNDVERVSLVTSLELNADEASRLSEELSDAISETESKAASVPAQEARGMPTERVLASDLAEAVKLGDQLGAIPALSSSFAQVAADRGVPIGLPGAESLGFIVPNFSALPWDAIARFRDHQGAMEARTRLREFEEETSMHERHQSPEFIRNTARAVTEGLMGAVKDLAPSLPDDLSSPVLSSAVGLVPIVGQYASLAISMGDMISALREHEKFEGSWIAAVFELRESAADAAIDW